MFDHKIFLGMKTMKELITLSCLLLFAASQMGAQVEAELTIENRLVSGSDFYFDIYLKTTAGSSGDLYLGNADFVLTFSGGDFSSPNLSKAPASSPGDCNFLPTIATGSNPLFTRDQYFTNTSTDIPGAELTINLNGPSPGDQGTFDTRVAKIDGTAGVHRLGRFKISGVSNPNTNGGLVWKTTGSGIVTRVFTLQNSSPFTSSLANIVATDPDNSCTDGPPSMVITSATPSVPVYQAEVEVSTSGTVSVPNGATKTYLAGTSILLNANFEVVLGAVFEATIEACSALQGGVKEK